MFAKAVRITLLLASLIMIPIVGESTAKGAGPATSPATAPASAATTPATSEPILEAAAALTDAQTQQARQLIDGGIAYLLANREEAGGWSIQGANRPALTAMVLKVLVQGGAGADSPVIAKGLEVLVSYQQPDGGIYDPAEGLGNYNTSLAVMALRAAGRGADDPALSRAVGYLRAQQIVPGGQSPAGPTVGEDDPHVGGVSYGKTGRPDLSNLGMWMDAMHEAGVAGDDPAMQRALAFVGRLQNRSESNPMAWAQQGSNDGGFVYALSPDGSAPQSKAGDDADGAGVRSYGSMTYTGFKSMLYADVDRDDPRVRAAWEWIRTYWRMDSNPNMPAAQSLEGLYYYYHVLARALRAWGQDVVTDAAGGQHNWRAELLEALASRGAPDGSWCNQADRWHEGSPVLVTAYAVLALQEALR